MREFFRDYGKTAGVFAAAAFLLSLLVGAIARNPFGVVLLRALLFGLLFAALGTGYRFLYAKYLSEPTAHGARKATDASGANVDIVLPEETPTYEYDAEEVPGEAEAAEEVEALEPSVGEDSESAPLGEGTSAAERPNGLSPEDLDAEGDLGGELLPVMEETEADSPELSQEPLPQDQPSPAEGQSSLDSLPDLMDLDAPTRPSQKSRDRGASGSAVDLGGVEPRPMGGVEPRGRGRRMAPGSSGQRPEDAVRNAVSEEDPASLARAIRTILKRDDKG